MGGVYDYSTTAGSNTTIAGVSVAEGWPAENVNNAIRGMAADLAKFRNDTGGALTLAGGPTAYTLTTNQGLTALADGIRVMAYVNVTNTSACTLAVDGLAAKDIRYMDERTSWISLSAGQLHDEMYAEFVYTSLAGGAWIWVNPQQLPSPGFLWGLTLSNNVADATNDIDIAVGSAADGTNISTMRLTTAITKQLDVNWVVGTNQGGLDTGAIANGTYHVWLIMRADTGVVDVLFSTSATAPTMPTNYTHKRRIGSIIRSGGAIVLFTQNGDEFIRSVPILDVSVTNPGTAAVTRTLSVPIGIKVGAKVVSVNDSTTVATSYILYLSDLAVADTAGANENASNILRTGPAAGTYRSGGQRDVIMTNTSGQIRSRMSVSDANLGVAIGTIGWIDTRGRNA